MKQKFQRLFNEERGNIMILFAGSLVIMIAFIGLSLDIGLFCLERNSLQNFSQVIREDRFTYQDTIRYADDPGRASYDIIHATLDANGYDGDLKVYFYELESPPESNFREYNIRTVLSKEVSFNFARVIGLTTTTISITLDGNEKYGDKLADVVWRPEENFGDIDYNGSYTMLPSPSTDPFHDQSDIPADMKIPS